MAVTLVWPSAAFSTKSDADSDYYAGADHAKYWDRVYEVQGRHGRTSYEWYGIGATDVEELLKDMLPMDGEVLVAGAGDSDLSGYLATRHDVVSIDFSAVIVERMRQKYPELRFEVMDARRTSFADGRFGAVVDKGLFDCLVKSADSRRYLAELRRVLRKPGVGGAPSAGVLLMMSMREPDPREFGAGWACDPVRTHLGALYMDVSELQPARPQPGTEGTIPYYITVCRTLPTDRQEI